MGSMATTTLMSFGEFERLEEGADQMELLKGELIRMPPRKRAHMEICERLFERLKSEVEHLRQARPGLRLGKVHVEMGYYFSGEPGSWLRPDISLTHPAQPGDPYYTGAPLMAFEVVSESDTARHLNEKVSQYLANGAAEVWLIYPGPARGLGVRWLGFRPPRNPLHPQRAAFGSRYPSERNSLTLAGVKPGHAHRTQVGAATTRAR